MPTRVKNAIEDGSLPTSDQTSRGTTPDPSWAFIIDAVPACISIHSPSGELLAANRMLCDVYGKPFPEIKGLSCDELFHGYDAECPHERVVRTGEAVQLPGDLHIAGRDLAVTLEPLLDEQGTVDGFVRVMRDVTRERLTQQQLMNAERFATLGQLLSGVAHDVGTPLNVISGYAEFLLMRTSPEGQGHKELSAILDQTRRIAAVFSRALDLARPPQGRTDAIEIKALLTETLDLVRHHLRRADVKACITCRITPPLIYGEAVQLRQAFFNLLLNGGQHVGNGGQLQVVIDEDADRPGFLGLTLLGREANGIVHDFSSSFAFFLAPETVSEPPAIGLYLSKRILDEAGAKMTATEAGEEGVGLTIYLPMKPGTRG